MDAGSYAKRHTHTFLRKARVFRWLFALVPLTIDCVLAYALIEAEFWQSFVEDFAEAQHFSLLNLSTKKKPDLRRVSP